MASIGFQHFGRQVLVAGVSALALSAVTSTMAQAEQHQKIDTLQLEIDRLQDKLDALREDQGEGKAEKPHGKKHHGKKGHGKKGHHGHHKEHHKNAKADDKTQVALSAQVNRGILVTDDGENSDVFFVDNDNSSTRINLTGETRFNEDISVGGVIEVQFESNSTAEVSQDNKRNVGPNNFTERKLEIFAGGDRYGKLWLGQGETASDGTSEADLSGTTVIGYSGVADLAGGIQFVDGDGNLSGVTIGDTFDNLDGLSRDDRIRYDTRSFAHTTLSVGAAADDRYDVALRYDRKLSGLHPFKAGIAYSSISSESDTVNGSASILLGEYAPGVNFTIAAGSRDFDEGGRDDASFFYGKLGYLTKFRGRVGKLGTTGFAIDYYDGADIDVDGDESTSIGVMAVQNVKRIGTDLYVGYRHHELDRGGEDFDDVDALLVGARLKF